jgi:hypothetical protein|eukprot:COSAG01_NODE_360_length_18184_cov_21.881780_3_plen_73_part_00
MQRSYTRVPWRTMHAYTIVQLACFAACAVTGALSGALGLLFPFVVLAIVPVRKWLLPLWFPSDALLWLDHNR